jgi:hypothetical protein
LSSTHRINGFYALSVVASTAPWKASVTSPPIANSITPEPLAKFTERDEFSLHLARGAAEARAGAGRNRMTRSI